MEVLWFSICRSTSPAGVREFQQVNACSNFNQFTDNVDTKLSSPERHGKTAQKQNIEIIIIMAVIMAKADCSDKGTYYDNVIANTP